MINVSLKILYKWNLMNKKIKKIMNKIECCTPGVVTFLALKQKNTCERKQNKREAGWVELPELISTRALKSAICCSVSFSAHIPWANSNTAVIKSPHAVTGHTTMNRQVIINIYPGDFTNGWRPLAKFSPKDLKTSDPANLPSKNTVLFCVLKKRLILTRTTSIEPKGKQCKKG